MTRNNGAEQLSHAMVKFFADYATEYEHSDPQNIWQPLDYYYYIKYATISNIFVGHFV